MRLIATILFTLYPLQAKAWKLIQSEMVALHTRRLEQLKKPAATPEDLSATSEPAEPSLFDMDLEDDDDDSFFTTAGTPAVSVDTQKLLFDAMVEKEKQTYMQLAATYLKSDPFSTWKDWSKGMPMLSEVARKWLAVPASSASSERVFSSAGLTISKKRTKLGAKRAATLVFLKTAWPTLQRFGVLYGGDGPTSELSKALMQVDSDSEAVAEDE